MSDVVDRDAETFQRSYAQQSKVAWFGKHYFIICLVTFGAEYGITDFSLNLLLGCRGKDSLSSRRDTRSCQNIRRQSTEFRSSIDQRGDWLGAEFFAFGIASDDVDLEGAHVLKIKPFCTYRQDGASYLANGGAFRLPANRSRD